LFLGQSLLAQEVNSQKDIFYVPRFSRETAAQGISYRDPRNLNWNHPPLPQDNQNPYLAGGKEFEKFLKHMPVVRGIYEMAEDREPVQLAGRKINFGFYSSKRRYSPDSISSLFQDNSFPVVRKRTSAGGGLLKAIGNALRNHKK